MAKTKKRKPAPTRTSELLKIKDRLRDLWLGAVGGYSHEDPHSADFIGYLSSDVETLGLFIGAVCLEFGVGDERENWAVKFSEIKHFDTPDTLAEWIFEEGEEKKAADASQ